MRRRSHRLVGIRGVLLFVCAVATAAVAAPPIVVLRALVPTGAAADGTSVNALIDERSETVWKLDALGRDEGVLFRFERSQALTTVELHSCNAAVPWTVFVNGRELSPSGAPTVADGAVRSFAVTAPTSTVFLRADRPSGCLSAVAFRDQGGVLDVRAPRVVRAALTTSKTLAPVDVYHPAFLFDQRPDFGWVEGDKGPGKGATVEVAFDDAVSLTGIEVWNGYHRSDDHYRKNARAKTIALAVNGADAGTFALRDQMAPQRHDLRAPDVRKLTLTMTNVVRGTKYEDLVLSELRFYDAAGPFTVELPALKEREEALRQKVAGTLLGEVLDRRLVSSCAAADNADVALTLKLRGNQTFVVYDARESFDANSVGDPLWSAEEVFDGGWNLEKNSGGQVVVGLYGRRHTTKTTREDAEEWQPYGGSSSGPSESYSTRTRIGGGKLKLRRLAAIPAPSRPAVVRDGNCSRSDDAILVEHPSFTAVVTVER